MTNVTNTRNQTSFMGTIKGAAIGALFGALIGFVAGSSATQAFSESPLLIIGATLIFSLALAVFGAILGLFVDLDRQENERAVSHVVAK